MIGKKFTSNSGLTFTVVRYINSKNMTIEFDETGYQVHTTYSHVSTGRIADRLSPSLCGVGVIGVGNHKTTQGLRKETKCYKTWKNMIYRCYSDKSNPSYTVYRSYKDCTVCEPWLNFQVFADWYFDNYPSDGRSYHLDKDLLVYGADIYSPETCMFISVAANEFIKKRSYKQSLLPVGVSFDTARGKYLGGYRDEQGKSRNKRFEDPYSAFCFHVSKKLDQLENKVSTGQVSEIEKSLILNFLNQEMKYVKTQRGQQASGLALFP